MSKSLKVPASCVLFAVVLSGALLMLYSVDSLLKESALATFGPKPAKTRASESHAENGTTRLEDVSVPTRRPSCKGCSEHIRKALEEFSLNWTKTEEEYDKLRFSLINSCNGFQKAFMTQTNSPLGSWIVYDGMVYKRRVDENFFNLFPKDTPFFDKILDTCAVVGNAGILTDSSCGEAIDSAQFVFRCNLPPLENGYSKHVGNKSSLVTANPSIFQEKYKSLAKSQQDFVDNVSIYGESLMFIPAFSYLPNTDLGVKVRNTLKDFGSPMKAVFMNPDYLRDLHKFWRSQGLNIGSRMSTGFMMISLALEMCNNVEAFGFWPFNHHPYGFQTLTSHYYDDKKPLRNFHAMPAEFGRLINLHNQGVVKLHVGACARVPEEGH